MNYAMIKDGAVANIAVWDGENAWDPDGFQVIPLPEGVSIGWLFVDEEFIAPPAPVKTPEELIAAAEQERQSRLSHAYAVTADWRTELALGVISDDDKAKLTLWMQYIKALKAIDPSTAPDVSRPEQPSTD